jgi:phosphoribosyl 1,2-cyclic phosphodiesterase
MIDAGKTMRDACMRHLYNHSVDQVDGLILTHGHADAIMGLDDLRDLQKSDKVVMDNGDIGCRILSGPLPIYLHQATMNVVTNCFGYLQQKGDYFPNTDVLKRRIALVDFYVIEQTAQLDMSGLPVRCFPVYHGGTYVSLGFDIGAPGELVYISDVKIIPDDTWAYLESVSPIKLLVLDVLSETGIYSHLGLSEALEIVDRLKPVRTLFTGMSCYLGDHDALCARIAATHPAVSVAFDGLTVDGLRFSM